MKRSDLLSFNATRWKELEHAYELGHDLSNEELPEADRAEYRKLHAKLLCQLEQPNTGLDDLLVGCHEMTLPVLRGEL